MQGFGFCGDICSRILSLDLSNGRQRFYVAYSGGVDSHVLLHCCASITQLKGKLTAVYIHHGLQAEADSWSDHCGTTAQELGVAFLALRVNAHPMQGESPEEAARNARYLAFKSLIQDDDVLLLAQHREDQLETVLLQLFRGSGLRGLSGMPERIAFGAGVMLRPLLGTSKQVLFDYAHHHQLSWVEDPSNQSNEYDRNYLRNAAIPLLKQRWPSIDITVARSAKHCAEAQALVEDVADALFATVFNPTDKTLIISLVKDHQPLHQQLIIRHWFRHNGLKMPTQAVVNRILTEVVFVARHRDPCLSVQSHTIRRYRDKLYCLKQTIEKKPVDCAWPSGKASIVISENQTIDCVPSSQGISSERWVNAKIELRFRKGGETICLPGRNGHHSLKNLFQEAGIPPWEREVMPLVYLDGALAAVADLWVSQAFYTEKPEGCISLLFQNEAVAPKRP
jgi:tRNA(Ile)-lysidine synthase